MTDQVKEPDPKWTLWQRNVQDKFKGLDVEEIKARMQKESAACAVLISNVENDFNLSCVLRVANNFNITKIFYYGKKKWDRRGAVGVNHYVNLNFLSSFEEIQALKSHYKFVAVENNIGGATQDIRKYQWSPNTLISFGSESRGLSDDKEVFELFEDFVEIPSLGSVRSLNVATAAAIAFYDYVSKVG